LIGAKPGGKSEQTGADAPLNRRLLRGGIWASLALGAAALAVFFANVLLARILSPRDLGIYYLALATALVTATAARAGATHACVRLVAGRMAHSDRAGAYAALVLTMKIGLAGGIVAALSIWLGAGRLLAHHVFHLPSFADLAGILAFWTMIMTLQFLVSEALRAFHRIGPAAVMAPQATSIFFLPLLLAVWAFSPIRDLEPAVLLVVGTHAATLIVGLCLLFRITRELPKGGHMPLPRFAKLAWPLWMTDMAFIVLVRGDLWLVGAFDTASNVALYGTAVQVALIISLPLKIANSVLPPLIAELFERGNLRQLEKTLQLSASLAMIPSVLTFILIVVAGRPMLGLLFGRFYEGAQPILLVLSAGQLLNCLAGSVGLTLMMTAHERAVMRASVSSTAVLIIGGIIGALHFGPIGVAGAATVALVFMNAMMWVEVKRKLGMSIHASFLRGLHIA
jgi:O-antigen/teichoic acid export membrane protein